MSAQTRTSNVSPSRPRRARSAEKALSVAQERHNSKTNAAVAAGHVAQLQKRTMKVTLRFPTHNFVTLVDPEPPLLPTFGYRSADCLRIRATIGEWEGGARLRRQNEASPTIEL